MAAAQKLFGNTAAANFLLVGAAYQTGALRIPASSVEEAITINGVAVSEFDAGGLKPQAKDITGEGDPADRYEMGVSPGPEGERRSSDAACYVQAALR